LLTLKHLFAEKVGKKKRNKKKKRKPKKIKEEGIPTKTRVEEKQGVPCVELKGKQGRNYASGPGPPRERGRSFQKR